MDKDFPALHTSLLDFIGPWSGLYCIVYYRSHLVRWLVAAVLLPGFIWSDKSVDMVEINLTCAHGKDISCSAIWNLRFRTWLVVRKISRVQSTESNLQCRNQSISASTSYPHFEKRRDFIHLFTSIFRVLIGFSDQEKRRKCLLVYEPQEQSILPKGSERQLSIVSFYQSPVISGTRCKGHPNVHFLAQSNNARGRHTPVACQPCHFILIC